MDTHLPSGRDFITEPIEPPLITGPWQIEVSDPTATSVRMLSLGQECVIGSASEVQWRVQDACVSRRHLLLRAEPQGLRVRDLESTNGVFVDAARIQSALLRGPHCTLLIGKTTICAAPWAESEGSGNEEPIAGIVGRSVAMRRLCRDIRRYAPLGAAVLLQGESGTGKDVVARAIHACSGRKGEFVALNVGGLSENLADAELFGYRKGAFTGAVGARRGVFEGAHGGTLFLDEIADLHPAIQVKLLRVLEDKRVRPLGTNDVVEVDTRVLCASWAQLEEQVQEGDFRADLYHRIATVRLEIPPLRKRKGDLAALAEHWLRRFEHELGPKQVTSAALARLLNYDWPGNIRELGSVLYRAAAESDGLTLIDLQHVERALPKEPLRRRKVFSGQDARRLLEENAGNVSAAARAARVPRTTFRTWLKRAGVTNIEAA